MVIYYRSAFLTVTSSCQSSYKHKIHVEGFWVRDSLLAATSKFVGTRVLGPATNGVSINSFTADLTKVLNVTMKVSVTSDDCTPVSVSSYGVMEGGNSYLVVIQFYTEAALNDQSVWKYGIFFTFMFCFINNFLFFFLSFFFLYIYSISVHSAAFLKLCISFVLMVQFLTCILFSFKTCFSLFQLSRKSPISSPTLSTAYLTKCSTYPPYVTVFTWDPLISKKFYQSLQLLLFKEWGIIRWVLWRDKIRSGWSN